MKAETQAVLLEKMMQEKKVHSYYELILPLFMVKSTVLKKLKIGDILLIGIDSLDLRVINDSICAIVEVTYNKNTIEIEIVAIEDHILTTTKSIKYEVVTCRFENSALKKFEIGVKYTIDKSVFDKVDIVINSEKKAKAKLIKIKDEIAIEIIEISDV